MQSKTSIVIALIAVSAIGLAVVSVYVHNEPSVKDAVALAPKSTNTNKSMESVPSHSNNSANLFVYLPHISTKGLSFTKSPIEPSNSGDPKIYAVNQFLIQSKIAPKDARLIGLDLKDGNAILGFNNSFKQSYGSFDEKELIDGLAVTLGQFEDVKSYTMEIAGVPITSLGEADLSEPVTIIPSNSDLSTPTWDDRHVASIEPSQKKITP